MIGLLYGLLCDSPTTEPAIVNAFFRNIRA
jgi:hypothetical protein